MSKNIKEAPEKVFPHLTPEEREEVVRLYEAWENKSSDYTSLSFNFMTTLESWMIQYFKWETLTDQKTTLRKKLLNVAGLWKIISSEDIHALLTRVAPYNKKPLSDLKPSNPYREYLEIASYDIKYMDDITAIMTNVFRDERETYLDFVAGRREINRHPASSFIIFKKNLSQEVVTEDYLSASAELLTKTILIDPFNADGTHRDPVLISFDLVFESALIDGFHNFFEKLDQDHLIFKAKSEACHFLLKYLANNEAQLTKQGRKNFVSYLKDGVLSPLVVQIAELTKKLKKNQISTDAPDDSDDE